MNNVRNFSKDSTKSLIQFCNSRNIKLDSNASRKEILEAIQKFLESELDSVNWSKTEEELKLDAEEILQKRLKETEKIIEEISDITDEIERLEEKYGLDNFFEKKYWKKHCGNLHSNFLDWSYENLGIQREEREQEIYWMQHNWEDADWDDWNNVYEGIEFLKSVLEHRESYKKEAIKFINQWDICVDETQTFGDLYTTNYDDYYIPETGEYNDEQYEHDVAMEYEQIRLQCLAAAEELDREFR